MTNRAVKHVSDSGNQNSNGPHQISLFLLASLLSLVVGDRESDSALGRD